MRALLLLLSLTLAGVHGELRLTIVKRLISLAKLGVRRQAWPSRDLSFMIHLDFPAAPPRRLEGAPAGRKLCLSLSFSLCQHRCWTG